MICKKCNNKLKCVDSASPLNEMVTYRRYVCYNCTSTYYTDEYPVYDEENTKSIISRTKEMNKSLKNKVKVKKQNMTYEQLKKAEQLKNDIKALNDLQINRDISKELRIWWTETIKQKKEELQAEFDAL